MVMILWGDTPAGEAQLYFPEFNAAEIITQAESMYPAHGLRLVDPHTISCDTGGATFIPLPAGTGLLSVELPAGLHRGDRYTAMVRQLTEVAGIPTPPPPQIQLATPAAVAPPAAVEPLIWRRVLGAFRVTMTISTREQLLIPQERLLALLRWVLESV
jgi:hypothetical protein